MNAEIQTEPEHHAPTEPAPPMSFGHDGRASAKAVLPDDEFTSDAGNIVNILHGGIGGTVSVLWCKAGAYRASHWHKEDSHRLYVLEGTVMYYERAIGSSETPEPELFIGGDGFDTPPQREHLMLFTEPTIMVSISSRTRTHEEHESDVVRVPRESWET